MEMTEGFFWVFWMKAARGALENVGTILRALEHFPNLQHITTRLLLCNLCNHCRGWYRIAMRFFLFSGQECGKGWWSTWEDKGGRFRISGSTDKDGRTEKCCPNLPFPLFSSPPSFPELFNSMGLTSNRYLLCTYYVETHLLRFIYFIKFWK